MPACAPTKEPGIAAGPGVGSQWRRALQAVVQLILQRVRGRENPGHFLQLQHDLANLPPGPWVIALDRHAVTAEYVLDPVLRDHKKIPLLGSGGIRALIRSRVLPYAPDALIVESDARIVHQPAWLNRAGR